MFAFAEPVDCEAQAEVLLNYARKTDTPLYKATVVLDNSGHLWLVGYWGGSLQSTGLHITRISPKGKNVLDDILLYRYHNILLHSHAVCDSRNNLYITFATPGRWKEPSDTSIGDTGLKIYSGRSNEVVYVVDGNYNPRVHLMRITPEGDFEDFHPWPGLGYYEHYLGLLQGDTLILAGSEDLGKPVRIVKATLTSEGITPVYDTPHTLANSIYKNQILGDYFQAIVNWYQGMGIEAAILHDRTDNPQYGPDNLHISRLKGGPEEKSKPLKANVYPWRDYVWRSYPNSWIGWLTFSDYKDGGYLLYIPDPLDRSTTYALRLDEEGTPIDPSTLKGKGKCSARSFNRLPESAKSQADFRWWKDNNSRRDYPDSARVSFWGCDEKGNLYNYTQLRKYPSERQ